MELHPPPPVLALSCPALTREGRRSANPWVAGWETLWDAGRGIGRKPLTPGSDYLLQLRHAWVGCGPWGSPNPSVPVKQQWRAMVASNYLTQMSLTPPCPAVLSCSNYLDWSKIISQDLRHRSAGCLIFTGPIFHFILSWLLKLGQIPSFPQTIFEVNYIWRTFCKWEPQRQKHWTANCC